MNKYEVTIKRSPRRKIGTGEDPRRGMITTTREADYLPRRKRKDGIRFWDLGQTSAGVTNPTHIANPANIDVGFPFPSPPDSQIDTMIASLDSSIAAVPTANWKDAFNRIDRSSLWDKGLLLAIGDEAAEPLRTSERWKDGGILDLSDDDLANFALTFDSDLFNGLAGFGNETPAGTKVTAVFDPGASSVTFTPSRQMNVYLMPSLIRSFSQVTYFVESDEVIEQLNFLWNVFDRNLYEPAGERDNETVMKAMSLARANRRVFPEGTLTTIPPSSFPGGGTPDYTTEFQVGGQSQFLFAIERGGEWFYFWRE